MTGDLSKGPRGTNQYSFTDLDYVPYEFMGGQLAESWETPDPVTVVVHLRKGVTFPDKPGVMASREMTADDVVFSLNRLVGSVKGKASYANIESISAQDKYTVTVKEKKFDAAWYMRIGCGTSSSIYPPELVKAGINDWKNAVGTGPFILKSYVSGASLTYERNPNYWEKTNINGKEYKLPFIDKIALPIIVDESTRLAASRTGKVDLYTYVSTKYKQTLEQTNPELLRWKVPTSGGYNIALRVDTKPFDDIRVRRALSMAIDRPAMVKSLYQGEEMFISWPFSAAWPESLYTPVEKLPQSTKELFEYNPEKARQLLTEAGYPNGFQSEMVIWSPSTVDAASMVVGMWEKELGVKVTLKPYDYNTYLSMMYGKAYKQMYLLVMGSSTPYSILDVALPTSSWNAANYNDPYYNEALDRANRTEDPSERDRLLKDLNVYLIDKCPFIVLPGWNYYAYAHPWVKNWYGEIVNAPRRTDTILATVWLDRDLREKMIGKR
jgi:peptide/nickel transport system substrate-binding protein